MLQTSACLGERRKDALFRFVTRDYEYHRRAIPAPYCLLNGSLLCSISVTLSLKGETCYQPMNAELDKLADLFYFLTEQCFVYLFIYFCVSELSPLMSLAAFILLPLKGEREKKKTVLFLYLLSLKSVWRQLYPLLA